MLHSQVLLEAPGLRVSQVHCPGHERRFGVPEPVTRPSIVLPVRGVFRLRVDGRETVVDPALTYLQVPGQEQQFAHPAGGDLCTSIDVGDPARPDLEALANRPVPIAPSVTVAHRLLLGRARAGAASLELTDRAAALVGEVFAGFGAAPVDTGPARALAVQRRLVEDARELLSCEPDLALPELARRLDTSPWRLSRLFHRLAGVPLHRYRTRLRVNAAIDRLAGDACGAGSRQRSSAGGADSLAALAVELGFADQAHLTRVVRDTTGLPPGRLRALLATAAESPGREPPGRKDARARGAPPDRGAQPVDRTVNASARLPGGSPAAAALPSSIGRSRDSKSSWEV
jgi:AraC-like DNA-binding protein